MAEWIYTVGAAGLVLALVVGLVRTVAGPTLADRMLSVQLLTSVGIALLAVMAQWSGMAALMDVAIVLALLAPVTSVAMTSMGRRDV